LEMLQLVPFVPSCFFSSLIPPSEHQGEEEAAEHPCEE
jgi:hypothetical protein